MKPRIDYQTHSPDLQKKLIALSLASHECALDKSLIHLVDIRTSQMNGCAFCLDMHTKEAKIDGERDLRLYHLPVWRESPLFTSKEKAALEWTELLTRLPEHGPVESIHARVSEELSEKEISDLTFTIGVINFWNRLRVGSPTIPGSLDTMFGLTKANLS